MKEQLSRQQYKDKFEKLMAEKFDYILQEGEQIVQCHEQYPPYWFISNKGKVFSVYRDEIRVLEPLYDTTGKMNKEGTRTGRDWRYATRVAGEKNLTRFNMARMILEHFSGCEFKSGEELEAHHIRKKNNFEEHEAAKCNSIDNLQFLPKSIHREVTHYASKTSAELDQELDNKVKKSGCPVYQLTQEQLQNIFLNALQSCTALGEQPYIVTTNITDDVSAIEAEAHPIRNIDII